VSGRLEDGLHASGISVHFGGLVALDGVDVHAPRGRITGLIGPNGAGKTTLFNVCSGYLRPAAGVVTLDGADITNDSAVHRSRMGIGRTFQRMELFWSMTVRDNVAFAVESADIQSDDPLVLFGLRQRGRRYRSAVDERTNTLLADAGLEAVADRRVSEVSTGHARLVELARALARRPAVLLLDEPSSGLDNAETRRFGALLRSVVATHGTGILLVEHDMSLVMDICDWIEVLEQGRPLFRGAPADVRASAAVRAAYLGRKAS
jgi:ABC-type branched-subunit amino acid transport system ATPase component